MIKKGYYIKKTQFSEVCFYISGVKKGNKFIQLKSVQRGMFLPNNDASWLDLSWTCVNARELESCDFYEINPTEFKLK